MLRFGLSVPSVEDLIELLGAVRGLVGRVLGGLWDVAVVQWVVGLTAIGLAYAVCYGLLLFFTKAYFIEIAPFRIWQEPAPGYLSEGLAARVVDELLLLQRDVREHGVSPGSGGSGVAFHKAAWQTPIAKRVTLEIKGFSLEAVHELLRRLCRRHIVVTTDAVPRDVKLRLIGRSARGGPWEVYAPAQHGTGEQRVALREFAVRAMVEVLPKTRKALANALAFKQSQADAAEEYEEALRLAELGRIAMPNHAVQFYNLGHAYQSSGELQRSIEAYDQAILRFEKEIEFTAPRALLQAARSLGRRVCRLPSWLRHRSERKRHLSWALAGSAKAFLLVAVHSETPADQTSSVNEALTRIDRARELDPGNSNLLDTKRQIEELQSGGTGSAGTEDDGGSNDEEIS